MTETELADEYRYRYEERLGILGVIGDPTPEQHKIANEEAQRTVDELRKP